LLWTLLSIAILLLVSKIAEEICHRIKQPSVVGYIVAGIVLGPTGLAVVHASPDIQIFFELGAIFLFFLIGFEEIDVPGLMTVFGKKLFYAGVLAFIIPLVFSLQFFVIFGYEQVTAFAISAVFAVTSLGVLAKVLMDLGYIRKPIGLVTFTTGAIVEFLGLLFVSVAIRMLDNPSNMLLDLVFFASTMIVYFIIAAVIGIYAMPRLLGFITKYGKTKEISLGILIGVILLFVVFAEWSGLHGAIGALLLGIMLSPLSKKIHAEISKGMHGLAYGLFVPMFFAGMGIYFNFSFTTLPLAIIIGVLFLNSVGKFLGALVGTIMTRLSAPIAVSFSMMSKGAVDMALMLTLFTIGIVDDRLFSLYIFSVLLVTMTFPTLMKASIKRASVSPEETTGVLTPSYIRTAGTDIVAKDLMSMFVESAHQDMTLDKFVVNHPDYETVNHFVFDDDARLVGTILKKDIDVPRERWATVRLKDCMKKDITTVLAKEDVYSVLEKMITTSEPNLPVVDDDDEKIVIGTISRSDINNILFRKSDYA